MALSPIERLQRYLETLRLLEGKPLRCVEGSYVAWIASTQDPSVLVSSCQEHGWPTKRALEQGLRLQGSLRPFSGPVLAACQRELRALQQDPEAREAYYDARGLRRFPEPTLAWLRETQQRIDSLSHWLAIHEQAPPPPWFLGILSLIAAIQGANAQHFWYQTALASFQVSSQRRHQGAQRLQELCMNLVQSVSEQADQDPLLATTLRILHRYTSRRSTRMAQQQVACFLSHPFPIHQPSDWGDTDGTLPLVEQVRRWGEAWLHSLPSTQSPEYKQKTQKTLAHYALVCSVSAGQKPLALLPHEWQALHKHQARLLPLLVTHPLSLSTLQVLCQAPIKEYQWEDWIPWVAEGLDPHLVVQLYKHKKENYVCHHKWPSREALHAYVSWLVQLTPLLQKLGLQADLTPATFQRWEQAKKQESLVLLQWLTQTEPPASLATLVDVALGLMKEVPQGIHGALGVLMAAPAGLGQQQAPSFAAWLGANAVLDEYLHLCALAEESHPLSNTLLRDFQRTEQLQKEQAYLASLSVPTPEQRQRLERVQRTLASNSLPTPAWTLRRLRERIQVLQPKAYQRKLDGLLLQLCHETLGLRLEGLTHTWRDALRFYLCTEDNHEALLRLLRFAATHPKKPWDVTLPRNQAWLRQASAHMNTEAWIQPRSQSVTLDHHQYVLAIEKDPLEVLRMGIPFDTCLSLNDGINAASTVLNAMDVNKQVVYVRNAAGSIVARKLLAVSEEWTLIGYNLYNALGKEWLPALEEAFLTFCNRLAQETGLALADKGTPTKIHPGFWYDDGTTPFQSAPVHDGVEAYCAQLRIPVPTKPNQVLQDEARSFLATAQGNVAVVLQELGNDTDPANHRLGQWLLTHWGEQEAWRQAKHHRTVVSAWAQRLLPAQPTLFFQQARVHHVEKIPYHAWWWDALLPSYETATALLAWAQSVKQWKEQDDHGLVHQALSTLPYHLQHASLPQVFSLCNAMEALWRRLLHHHPSCEDCYQTARKTLQNNALRQYRNHPDPEALIHALHNKKLGLLAHETALFVVARMPLPARGKDPAPWSPLQETEPLYGESIATWRALQELPSHHAELATAPDLLAAWVRHAPPWVRKHKHLTWPQPQKPAFASLGGFVLTDPWVASWLLHRPHSEVNPKEWTPDFWELCYHRRHLTSLRKQFRQQARVGPRSAELLQSLGQLGEEELLQELGPTVWGHKLQSKWSEVQPHAEWVHLQLHNDPAGCLAAWWERRNHDKFTSVFKNLPIDAQLVTYAVKQLLAPATSREFPPSFLLYVLASSRVAMLPAYECLLRLDPSETSEPFSDKHPLNLLSTCPNDPFLFSRLWQYPMVQPEIYTWGPLSREIDAARVDCWERAAAQQGLSLPGCLEQHVAQILQTKKGWLSTDDIRGEAQWRRVIRIALTQPTPQLWLRLYFNTPDWRTVGIFIDELRQHPPALESIQAALEELQPEKDRSSYEQARVDCLLAALATQEPKEPKMT